MAEEKNIETTGTTEQETKKDGCKGENKGKPNKRRGKSKRNKSSSGKQPPKRNDWQFYAINEQLAKDTASFPYNRIPGIPSTVNAQYYGTDSQVNTVACSDQITGIVTLDYINSIGVTQSRVDGVNTAATQLYTFIRQRNSGAKNYEAADVMMYVLAMRDIYSLYFELKRALGAINVIPIENRNIPKLLVETLGLNYEDLRANAANYRAKLNLLAVQINAFAVPDYFKAFDRAAFIASNIFADSSSVRGQMYLYRMRGYYRWTPGTGTGTELVFTPFNDAQAGSILDKFQDRLDTLDTMLSSLYLDEDANTISGDILKAFGDTHLYKVLPTDESYSIGFLFNEDALAQIENSTSLNHLGIEQALNSGDNTRISMFNVTQSNQVITFKPSFTASANGNPAITMGHFVLNSHKDNPDYKDNLEWTRMLTSASLSATTTDGTFQATIDCCGLEILVKHTMYWLTSDGSESETLNSVINNEILANPIQIDALLRIQQCDWHPMIYGFDTSKTTLTTAGDLKVSTVVSKDSIIATHKLAVTAAFFAESLYTMTNIGTK